MQLYFKRLIFILNLHVFGVLKSIDINSPDYTGIHGCSYCDCEADHDNDLCLFFVSIPFTVLNFEEERTLSIINCSECQKWALCD